MTAFLEQLAKALLDEHGGSLQRVAVVLPSQRAGLYLREALARHAGKALWSPEVFTLPSFMERLSGLRTLPMEELLFEAYEAYRTVAGPDARPLDDFMEWAPVTLSDMSEADANMVRLDGFYRDLRSWEEIDWSFNTDPLSEGQQRMVRYWALAGKMHHALNDRLLSQNVGTSGLVERMAAEKGETAFEWERVWFAGLNAFTVAEQRVLDSARDASMARFAWDADRYYLDAPEQEAGQHLRAAIKRYGAGAIPPGNALRDPGPHLDVLRASDPVMQVWCAADRLRSRSPEERARTAIVLADEGLLPALLEALPSDTGPVNVTMGQTLAALPVGSLMETFFRACTASEGSEAWPVEAIAHVLGHPFLRRAADDALMNGAIAAIVAKRPPRLGHERIGEALAGMDGHIDRLARIVFDPGADGGMHARIMALLSWAKNATTADRFATEQIHRTSIVLGKAAGLLERYGHSLNAKAWAAVMMRLLRTARIGLYGEPLAGLQVMGLLEARGLDPRHIILLSAQEGKLPASSIERSYVPFELRRAHGLPLRDSGDAVQAYNFLRLVQRAEDALLIHDDQGAANGPSRFIEQLRHGLVIRGSGRMVFLNARAPMLAHGATPLAIPNDPETIARITDLLQQGLSPTALRAWLRCPLDFWFRYVQGLCEPDIPGARIGGDVLGNALHGVLEDIHRPWLGRPIDAREVDAAIPGFEDALRARLEKEVGAEGLASGQPLLQVGMATRAAENFLRGEARAVRTGAHIVPIALEAGFRAELQTVGIPGGVRAVIKGRLDRVDERDGLVHILDLKTGRVDGSALRIKELSLDALKGDKGYAAQLLVYAWLYLTLNPDVQEVRTGLQPLQRSNGSDGLYLRLGDRDRIARADMQAIEELLTGVVRELLDPSTTFAHDTDSAYCTFCV